MNILLIESDNGLLQNLSSKLTEQGYKVFAANTGSKAMNISMDNIVDLVICDLIFPIVSNITFLSIRKNFMAANVPVIIMSSLVQAKEILRNMGIQFEFFIEKPAQLEKLLEIISKSVVKYSIAPAISNHRYEPWTQIPPQGAG